MPQHHTYVPLVYCIDTTVREPSVLLTLAGAKLGFLEGQRERGILT